MYFQIEVELPVLLGFQKCLFSGFLTFSAKTVQKCTISEVGNSPYLPYFSTDFCCIMYLMKPTEIRNSRIRSISYEFETWTKNAESVEVFRLLFEAST